ncbi:GDP-mannose 4,6-dehydratase [Aureliella helgolandensis]|uniref:GDP-mannose 4,6-dehydratase n=1 Tax=Aureliella helgolandensis TaxID=2527968 RepID=A0A518G394_9BACT|nr:GDP-mannose 4,6-dehydratase [Aureliella helgolandensis]QDV23054.1 GDP-mannose 4,6-dehydratase [Aureliella helgolandensis]
MPTALVTGISGQDGAYLAELLLQRGYIVHGLSRSHRASLPHLEGTSPNANLKFHRQPACQGAAWRALLEETAPDEIYHLAADSFIPNGWLDPAANIESNYSLTVHMLEAIRSECPHSRFLNACSREIFGHAASPSANEQTVMKPITPYGINKAASRWLVSSYREEYGLFATNAILFNHESPLRPAKFVTRKIAQGVAKIACGLSDYIELGNLQARRDWGFAGDYVDAMWRMLQANDPEDFVIGTGKTHSIAEFAELAFDVIGLDWEAHVKTAPALRRSCDAAAVAADSSLAREKLAWSAKMQLPELVRSMVMHDLSTVEQSLTAQHVA